MFSVHELDIIKKNLEMVSEKTLGVPYFPCFTPFKTQVREK